MSKWADENNGKFSDVKYSLWTNGEDVRNNDMVGQWVIEPMTVYFSSHEIAEKASVKFGDEILKVWGNGN